MSQNSEGRLAMLRRYAMQRWLAFWSSCSVLTHIRDLIDSWLLEPRKVLSLTDSFM